MVELLCHFSLSLFRSLFSVPPFPKDSPYLPSPRTACPSPCPISRKLRPDVFVSATSPVPPPFYFLVRFLLLSQSSSFFRPAFSVDALFPGAYWSISPSSIYCYCAPLYTPHDFVSVPLFMLLSGFLLSYRICLVFLFRRFLYHGSSPETSTHCLLSFTLLGLFFFFLSLINVSHEQPADPSPDLPLGQPPHSQLPFALLFQSWFARFFVERGTFVDASARAHRPLPLSPGWFSGLPDRTYFLSPRIFVLVFLCSEDFFCFLFPRTMLFFSLSPRPVSYIGRSGFRPVSFFLSPTRPLSTSYVFSLLLLTLENSFPVPRRRPTPTVHPSYFSSSLFFSLALYRPLNISIPILFPSLLS